MLPRILAPRGGRMKLFKSVDEKLSEIGFKKSYESDSSVDYEKYVERFNFVHKVSIVHKSSGKHILQSYDPELIGDNFTGNIGVGLTGYEMKLFLKKMKQMGLYSK